MEDDFDETTDSAPDEGVYEYSEVTCDVKGDGKEHLKLRSKNEYDPRNAQANSLNIESYDLFKYEREFYSEDQSSSDESYSDASDSESCTTTSYDYYDGDDEDDDFFDNTFFEQFEKEYTASSTVQDSSSNSHTEFFGDQDTNGPPYVEKFNLDEYRPLIADLLKKPKRVFPKKYKLNPEKALRKKIDVPEEPNPLDEVDVSHLKMPPPDYEYKFTKPDHPDYLGEIPEELNEPHVPWFKECPSLFPEDDESTTTETGSTFVTDSSEIFSSEEEFDSEQLSSCPEDRPLYPVKFTEEEVRPRRIPLPVEFDVMPKNNPEVQIWYDWEANEYLDVKNEKGEWETVQQIKTVYPPPEPKIAGPSDLFPDFCEYLDDIEARNQAAADDNQGRYACHCGSTQQTKRDKANKTDQSGNSDHSENRGNSTVECVNLDRDKSDIPRSSEKSDKDGSSTKSETLNRGERPDSVKFSQDHKVFQEKDFENETHYDKNDIPEKSVSFINDETLNQSVNSTQNHVGREVNLENSGILKQYDLVNKGEILEETFSDIRDKISKQGENSTQNHEVCYTENVENTFNHGKDTDKSENCNENFSGICNERLNKNHNQAEYSENSSTPDRHQYVDKHPNSGESVNLSHDGKPDQRVNLHRPKIVDENGEFDCGESSSKSGTLSRSQVHFRSLGASPSLKYPKRGVFPDEYHPYNADNIDTANTKINLHQERKQMLGFTPTSHLGNHIFGNNQRHSSTATPGGYLAVTTRHMLL